MFYPRVGGAVDWDAALPTGRDAWQYLVDAVSAYLDVLSAQETMTTFVAQWDMFKEELQAKSLAPWAGTGDIEGPDGCWWGVVKRQTTLDEDEED